MLFSKHPRKRIFVDVASVCERGLVRPDNQDHVLVNRRNCVFCVADGMGGGDGGAEASEIVCSTISEAVARRTDFANRLRLVDVALAKANSSIHDHAVAHGYAKMATTATVLVLDAEESDNAVVGNIGDSRIYRFRHDKLKQLSRDHTMANELISCTQSSTDAIVRRSLSHVLTRAVGVEPELAVDWRRIEVRHGDAFLLCSDGVYDMVDDGELRAAFAADGNASAIVRRISEKAIAAGAEDNFSIVVVKVRRSK